jgi:hypothetical protein
MHASNDHDGRSRRWIETAAREAIELDADRTLTDAEWAAARARLLKFVDILRDWERSATTSRRGNVK